MPRAVLPLAVVPLAFLARALVLAVFASVIATSALAQSSSPSPTATSALAQSSSPSPSAPWPSGDELRRELQDIGFAFRIDDDSGIWSGWAPRAEASEGPALRLDGAGTLDAAATFDFELIEGDTGPALTALFEVTARLPLVAADVERARRFLVDDLLAAPPQTLEPCYTTDWVHGAMLVIVDTETTTAQLRLASSADAATDLDAELDPAECAPLIPAEIAAILGDPSTERLTIGMGGDPITFDPSEVTLEGALVTLVLTFRNDTTVDQTLTFEAPLESDTGLVAPGEVRLIVVRQLQPGEYPFHSETAPADLRGAIHIEAPSAD